MGRSTVGDPRTPHKRGARRSLPALNGEPGWTAPDAAIVRVATRPGRIGVGLFALAPLGVIVEAEAAQMGGPERVLVAGDSVLVGGLAGLGLAHAATRGASRRRGRSPPSRRST